MQQLSETFLIIILPLLPGDNPFHPLGVKRKRKKKRQEREHQEWRAKEKAKRKEKSEREILTYAPYSYIDNGQMDGLPIHPFLFTFSQSQLFLVMR